jgi:hypothetical protein
MDADILRKHYGKNCVGDHILNDVLPKALSAIAP